MPEQFFLVTYRSRLRGPISSGRIHRHVSDYERDAARAIADEGVDMALKRYNRVLRKQTPHFIRGVGKRQLAPNRWEIHDRGDVPYNFWLEGTGTMNYPRTRFKGYHTLAITEEKLRARRQAIARRILRQHRARGRLV